MGNGGIPPQSFMAEIYRKVNEFIYKALREHRVNLSGGDGAISGTLPTGNGGTGNGRGEALPKGPAGGDLDGEYPNPTVAKIQGFPVLDDAPALGEVLRWNGAAYEPATVSSGGGDGDGGVPTPPRAGLFLYSIGNAAGNYVWADIITDNEDDGSIVLDDDGSIVVDYA